MDELESRELESAVEGILFASGEPVHVDRICTALSIARDGALQILERLRDYYTYERRGIRLLRMDDNWQLCSAPDHADVIRKAFEIRKPAKLSQPALEALTIIAYYQPTTRAYVDKLRGVDSSYTVNMLQERGLIEACGRLQVPGRPVLYRTTEQFLRAFHLSSLEELPPLPGTEDTPGSTGEAEQLTLPMEPRRAAQAEPYRSQHPSRSADPSQPGDSPLTDSSQSVPDIPPLPDIPEIPGIADLPEIPGIPGIPDDPDTLPDDVLTGMSGQAEPPQTADFSSERRRGSAGKRKSPPFPRRGLKKQWRGQFSRHGDCPRRTCHKSRRGLLLKRKNALAKRKTALLHRKAAWLKCKNMLSGRGNILLNSPVSHMEPPGEHASGSHGNASDSHPEVSDHCAEISGKSGETAETSGKDEKAAEISGKDEKSSENCRNASGRHRNISGRCIRCLLYGCWLSWPWWWG